MKEKKNLLFVFADQWRADAIGYAKADPVITPNMDAFCEDATYCDHAFSTFPVCSPHRASLLTGRYPLSLGFFTNCKSGLSLRLKDEEISIAQVLKQQGYQTAYIGKWHLDEPEINKNPSPKSGASGWDAYTPPGVRRHGFDYWYSYGTYDMHLNPHYWQNSEEMISVDQWSVEHETDKAIEYLCSVRKKEEPFVLFLSWNPPHSPYDQVPQRYLDRYPDIALKKNVISGKTVHHTGQLGTETEEDLCLSTRQYYAAVSGLDEQFGRIIKCLKAEDLYEDTIVVLSSDHGDMMGSHGLMGKHVWFEESIRIPFVIRIEGNRKRFCHTCIGSQDMMPTLLSLLNVASPDSVEGDNCAQYITTEAEDYERVSFLCACPGGAEIVRQFESAGKDPKDYGWRAVRSQDYTYVMELGYQLEPKPERHLYCTKDDPLQCNPMDLSDPEANITAQKLENQILKWMERQNDGFLTVWHTFAPTLK